MKGAVGYPKLKAQISSFQVDWSNTRFFLLTQNQVEWTGSNMVLHLFLQLKYSSMRETYYFPNVWQFPSAASFCLSTFLQKKLQNH